MVGLAITSVLVGALASAPLFDVTYDFSVADQTGGRFLYQLRAFVDGQEATIDYSGVHVYPTPGHMVIDLDFAGMQTTGSGRRPGGGTSTP
ncbi:MAG: hypothetical protein A2Y77_12635 [Planctomycetes bacterium RBG_13_62_9]|nr:MAG: hypothetical protein A2Y77_12635 [Planctomycetes bacterium RBG_13_62_9]